MTAPSAEEREAWRALAEGATGGPWEFNAVDSLHDDTAGWVGHDRTGDGFQEFVCEVANHPDGLGDGAFIAAAREGWPRTLAALEAAEAELRAETRRADKLKVKADHYEGLFQSREVAE